MYGTLGVCGSTGYTNKPRLGSGPFWMLTNRHFGQFGDLSQMLRDHQWHACDENKHLWSDSHFHIEWKTGSFMQEKRQSLPGLAQSHPCSESTWETCLQCFTSQIPQPESKQVWKKLCRLPSETWQALCTVSLPQKKEIREEVGVQILLSIVKNLLGQKRGTTTAMFRKAEATPSKWCSIQMKFCLDRINVWHDSVCCRGFLSLPWILIKKEIWGFIFSDPKVPEFIN